VPVTQTLLRHSSPGLQMPLSLQSHRSLPTRQVVEAASVLAVPPQPLFNRSVEYTASMQNRVRFMAGIPFTSRPTASGSSKPRQLITNGHLVPRTSILRAKPGSRARVRLELTRTMREAEPHVCASRRRAVTRSRENAPPPDIQRVRVNRKATLATSTRRGSTSERGFLRHARRVPPAD